MAERVGFEPTKGLLLYLVSSEALSADSAISPCCLYVSLRAIQLFLRLKGLEARQSVRNMSISMLTDYHNNTKKSIGFVVQLNHARRQGNLGIRSG